MSETRLATPRLVLVPFDISMLQAILDGATAFEELTTWNLPDHFSEFPESISYTITSLKDSAPVFPWVSYAIIHPDLNRYIGQCGYKSVPSSDGSIEIGYEISRDHRMNGFAAEVIKQLIDTAFEDRQIRKIIAHTLAVINASNHLLIKNGFVFDYMIHDVEDGDIWKWTLSRSAYNFKNLINK